MYLQPKQGNHGNMMRAGARLQLHSPRGGGWREVDLGSLAEREAASAALLPGCLLERKRVEI